MNLLARKYLLSGINENKAQNFIFILGNCILIQSDGFSQMPFQSVTVNGSLKYFFWYRHCCLKGSRPVFSTKVGKHHFYREDESTLTGVEKI